MENIAPGGFRNPLSNACVPTTADERLCDLHSKTKKAVDVLAAELERLQKEQVFLIETASHQNDSQTNVKVFENAVLQDALEQQILCLMRTLTSFHKELKNAKLLDEKPSQPTPAEQVCATDVQHPTCKGISNEKPETQLESKRTVAFQPCKFIDDDDQFCMFCNQVFMVTTDLLNHLHKQHSHDMEHVAPSARPWFLSKHQQKMVAEGQATCLPLQGVEFLIPCSAFFCNLCKQFYGDVFAARNHLESEEHNLCYDQLSATNPEFMQTLKEMHGAKKRAALSQGLKRKSTDDCRNPDQIKSTPSKRPVGDAVVKRNNPENFLWKPAASKEHSSPDVVSDILNLMSQNIEGSKAESTKIQDETESCHKGVGQAPEAIANIPEGANCDELREAMNCFGKKTEIHSILRKDINEGGKLAQNSKGNIWNRRRRKKKIEEKMETLSKEKKKTVFGTLREKLNRAYGIKQRQKFPQKLDTVSTATCVPEVEAEANAKHSSFSNGGEGKGSEQDETFKEKLSVESMENQDSSDKAPKPISFFDENVQEMTIVCETGHENISIPVLVYESTPNVPNAAKF